MYAAGHISVGSPFSSASRACLFSIPQGALRTAGLAHVATCSTAPPSGRGLGQAVPHTPAAGTEECVTQHPHGCLLPLFHSFIQEMFACLLWARPGSRWRRYGSTEDRALCLWNQRGMGAVGNKEHYVRNKILASDICCKETKQSWRGTEGDMHSSLLRLRSGLILPALRKNHSRLVPREGGGALPGFPHYLACEPITHACF